MSQNLIVKPDDKLYLYRSALADGVAGDSEALEEPLNLQEAIDLLEEVIAEGLDTQRVNDVLDSAAVRRSEDRRRRNSTEADAVRRRRQVMTLMLAQVEILERRLRLNVAVTDLRASAAKRRVRRQLTRIRQCLQKLGRASLDTVDIQLVEDELNQSLMSAYRALQECEHSYFAPNGGDLDSVHLASDLSLPVSRAREKVEVKHACVARPCPVGAVEQFARITGFGARQDSDRTPVRGTNSPGLFVAASAVADGDLVAPKVSGPPGVRLADLSAEDECDAGECGQGKMRTARAGFFAGAGRAVKAVGGDLLAGLFGGRVEIRKHVPLIVQGTELEHREIIRLVGAPNGSEIEIIYSSEAARYELFIHHECFERPAIVQIVQNDVQGTELYWHHIVLRASAAGRQLGRRIVMESLMQAAQLQFDTVATPAIGAYGTEYQGYRVWPYLGFDRQLSRRELKALQSGLTEDEKHSLRIEEDFLPAQLSRAQSIIELMPSSLGRMWWKLYGTGGLLNFDLTAASQSWRRFNQAARESNFVHLAHMSQMFLRK